MIIKPDEIIKDGDIIYFTDNDIRVAGKTIELAKGETTNTLNDTYYNAQVPYRIDYIERNKKIVGMDEEMKQGDMAYFADGRQMQIFGLSGKTPNQENREHPGASPITFVTREARISRKEYKRRVKKALDYIKDVVRETDGDELVSNANIRHITTILNGG